MNRDTFEERFGIKKGDLIYLVKPQCANVVDLHAGIYVQIKETKENFWLLQEVDMTFMREEFNFQHMGVCLWQNPMRMKWNTMRFLMQE